MSTDSDPPLLTPCPNAPVLWCEEYEQLKSALRAYLDHEPEDPDWGDVWRALAAILGEYQRETFREASGLGAPAETACIRRLITGDEECRHDPVGGDPDPQGPPYNQWFALFEFAEHRGLEVSILPKSWYNLGSTVHVVCYPPERYR